MRIPLRVLHFTPDGSFTFYSRSRVRASAIPSVAAIVPSSEALKSTSKIIYIYVHVDIYETKCLISKGVFCRGVSGNFRGYFNRQPISRLRSLSDSLRFVQGANLS